MSDIVTDLRTLTTMPEHDRAADMFEKCAAEVERLREVLKLFECDCEGEEYCYRREKCRNYIARAALANAEPQETE